LVCGTAKAAVLVAAGNLATVSMPVAVLMKGVLKSMFIAKLKMAVGFCALAVLTLGFGAAAYQTGGAQQKTPSANQSIGKPLNELEALRKENELLKLNLQVVLEKVHAQEIELHAHRSKTAVKWFAPATPASPPPPLVPIGKQEAPFRESSSPRSPASASSLVPIGKQYAPDGTAIPPSAPMSETKPATPGSSIGAYNAYNFSYSSSEEALRRLREAKSDDVRRQAVEDLEKAVQRLRQVLNQTKGYDDPQVK
jgi:hypothetical protein